MPQIPRAIPARILQSPEQSHPRGEPSVSPPVTSLPVPENRSPQIDEDRVAMSKEALKHAFLDNLFYIQGKFPALATKNDYYMALAYAVRDRMLQRWISTAAAYTKQGSRTVAYLSAEFLMGPHLGNNLINLGIYDTARTAVAELGLDLEEMLAQEDEPGLGNRSEERRVGKECRSRWGADDEEKKERVSTGRRARQ